MDGFISPVAPFWLAALFAPPVVDVPDWLCGTVTVTPAVTGDADLLVAIDADYTLYPMGCGP
jgi:hypothetical protein